MERIAILDAVFEAVKPIRSLPPWHGARWSAWLHFACRKIGLDLESLVLSILPLQHGHAPILPGQEVVLRLTITCRGLAAIPALAAALLSGPAQGEFCSETLRLIYFRDHRGNKFFPQNRLRFYPALLDSSDFAREIRQLRTLAGFSLRFLSPLRLPKSGKRGSGSVARFCHPADLASGDVLAHLLTKIRGAAYEVVSPCPQATEAFLKWHDLQYNPLRKMRLGGVVGQISFKSTPTSEIAALLVLGQYLGCGKNGRFGFGYWVIPELAMHHSLLLPEPFWPA